MLIFVTGATGFIGSDVIPQLLDAGHQVLGLARSSQSAERLRDLGAEAHMGTLEDPASLTRGAEKADAVIHLAFDHDFAHFAANCEKDANAITALGKPLIGSDRPMLITSGIGMGIAVPGQAALEDVLDLEHKNPRIASEKAGQDLLQSGVNLVTIRLSQIHDTRRQGLVSYLIDAALACKTAVYLGEGRTRWSACHLDDAALLYRLALEKARPGARYHAVDEEGVSLRDIAEAIGTRFDLPVRSITPDEALDFLGPMAGFAALDMPASSLQTRQALNWKPGGLRLLEDIAAIPQQG